VVPFNYFSKVTILPCSYYIAIFVSMCRSISWLKVGAQDCQIFMIDPEYSAGHVLEEFKSW